MDAGNHRAPVAIRFSAGLGAKSVALRASWSDWKQDHPTELVGDFYVYQRSLSSGYHEFKFVVDGEYICSPLFPMTLSPPQNNRIDVEIPIRVRLKCNRGSDPPFLFTVHSNSTIEETIWRATRICELSDSEGDYELRLKNCSLIRDPSDLFRNDLVFLSIKDDSANSNDSNEERDSSDSSAPSSPPSSSLSRPPPSYWALKVVKYSVLDPITKKSLATFSSEDAAFEWIKENPHPSNRPYIIHNTPNPGVFMSAVNFGCEVSSPQLRQ